MLLLSPADPSLNLSTPVILGGKESVSLDESALLEATFVFHS